MRNINKKLFTGILTAAAVTGLISLVSAAATTYTDSDGDEFTYTKDNKGINITEVKDNGNGEMTIPAEIEGTTIYRFSSAKAGLTSLDTSKCPSLTHLLCRNDKLTTLDVSKNTELDTLYCDENQLQNSFTRKGDEYWALTPVCFRSDVLNKYIANADRYFVNDAYLDAPSWGLKMDNDRTDGLVVVFLKDLSDIPFEEQQHWRKYNIIPPETAVLSNTAIKRSFWGMPTNPSADHALIFKQKYNEMRKKWNDKKGWDLIKPLSDKDEKDFNNLHQMTDDNNLKDFTYQILTLTRSIIDSLNEQELLNRTDITDTDYQKYMADPNNKKDGSLLRLEWYLKTNGHYDAEMLAYLRKLQSYRSKNAAHRRGTTDKELQKLERYFGLDKASQKDALDGIFSQLTGYMGYFETLCM